MTEKEKMIAGHLYDCADAQLMQDRAAARELCIRFNAAPGREEQRAVLKKLLGSMGERCTFSPGFHCDYGYNIHIGDFFYANYNCVILDCAPVTIGDNVLIAPNCGLYTAGHPIHPEQRRTTLEYALPITIGSSVWLGGGVTVLPGVTIGDNAVIGAGSVVTKDIPAGVVAAGNPCRPIRAITEADRLPLSGHVRARR